MCCAATDRGLWRLKFNPIPCPKTVRVFSAEVRGVEGAGSSAAARWRPRRWLGSGRDTEQGRPVKCDTSFAFFFPVVEEESNVLLIQLNCHYIWTLFSMNMSAVADVICLHPPCGGQRTAAPPRHWRGHCQWSPVSGGQGTGAQPHSGDSDTRIQRHT